jgi:hypothetical protein
VLSRKREISSAPSPAAEPATLEQRLAALESGQETGEDFDSLSWFWMILLGIVIPVVLLFVGWRYA